MSSFISPPIRQLVCAWKTHPEGVEASKQDATAWITGCLDSLKRLRPLVIWTESIDELFNQAQLDLKEALRLVGERQLAPADRADALAAAVVRYYGQLLQLQTEEASRPAFSPILSLDQLIKVAFNVLKNQCEVFEIQTRFGLVVSDIRQLRSQWNVRKSLFPDVKWAPSIDEHLDQIEGGLGAVAQYLEKGEVILLEEAIQLMGKGSSDYAEKVYASDAEMRAAYRFSQHDAIECWLRLQEHPFDLGEEVTTQAWDRLFQEVDSYQRTVQTSKRAGLSVAQPELIEAAGVIHQEALDRLNYLSTHPLPAAEVAPMLNSPWEHMDGFRAAIRKALADLHAVFQGAPRMLELVELLGQCDAGLLPAWVLRDEINQRMEQHKLSLEAFAEAPQVPESIPPLLESHEQAYQRLLLYCEDGKTEHLVEGWKLLSMTMPPLIAYEAQLRKGLSKTGKSGQQVTCVRCGEVQSPQKVCSKCGSSLPQLQIDEVHYEDISSTGEAPPVSVADHLIEMVDGLNFGSSSWDLIREEIVRQIGVLEKTRGRFEREAVAIMGRDESFDVYCQFFITRMGQLSQALMTLGEAAQGQQLVNLKSGLASYRQLHEELIEFQKKIAEGIRKLPK